MINVARGAVVDTDALYEALVNGEIRGAGTDVFEKEPILADNPLATLKETGKLQLTPHMAWASIEARERCVEETGKYRGIYQRRRTQPGCVNFLQHFAPAIRFPNESRITKLLLYRMPEYVPVKGRNKSIIVVSIKILDTAAFRRCQMRQHGSGCENFVTVLLFRWK